MQQCNCSVSLGQRTTRRAKIFGGLGPELRRLFTLSHLEDLAELVHRHLQCPVADHLLTQRQQDNAVLAHNIGPTVGHGLFSIDRQCFPKGFEEAAPQLGGIHSLCSGRH